MIIPSFWTKVDIKSINTEFYCRREIIFFFLIGKKIYIKEKDQCVHKVCTQSILRKSSNYKTPLKINKYHSFGKGKKQG